MLGGAPFNVAWHLNGFGLDPLFISSVGDDARGNQIIHTMQQWNMDTSGVQVSKQYPTGKVTIKLENGIPEFNIVPDQAYDNIDESVLAAIDKSRASMLYHGSLALRNDCSRHTLTRIREQIDVPVFVDINLRDPWWDEDSVLPSLSNASWAKLNDDELAEVCKMEDIHEPDIEKAACILQDKLELELLIITLGEHGAYFISDKQSFPGKPVAVNNMVDTVGAGDSFSAVTIVGLLNGWSTQEISSRAMKFASAICQMRGATTTDNQFYKDIMEQW